MGRRVVQFVFLLMISGSVMPSAIPIWEMLSYEEKMGRLMYVFNHLVERYCKTSSSLDCRKTMMLHGTSNLLNYDEYSLDLLDPDQRDASKQVWQAATKSQYKFPPEKSYAQETYKSYPDQHLSYSSSNDDGPQRVVVPAPKFFRRNMGRRY